MCCFTGRRHICAIRCRFLPFGTAECLFTAALPGLFWHCGIFAQIKYPFLGLTDLVVLYAPIGIFLGRLANFVNDELWGRPADVPWAVKFPNGGYVPRHPSQLYEALTEGLLMFLILNWLWRYKSVRSRTGTVSAVFAILYAVSG